MSVLGGFELLSRSLRNYKEDRAKHEQTMLMGELENAKLQDALNDPRLKFERAQAKYQMEEVDVTFSLPGTEAMSLDQRARFNRIAKPAVQKILGEGIELNENNEPVLLGTKTKLKKPRWEAQLLHDQVQTAATMSMLGNNQREIDIEDQINKIAELKRNSNTYLDVGLDPKMKSLAIKNAEAKLAKMQFEQMDPQSRVRNLMTDNDQIAEAIQQNLMGGRPNKLLIEALDQMTARNNAEIKMYLDQNDVKNLKEYKYYSVNPDGSVVETSKFIDPRKEAPASFTQGGITYKLGSWEKGTSSAEGTGTKALTEPQKNTIIQALTKARILLGQGQIDKETAEQFQGMLTSIDPATDAGEASMLSLAFKTNAPNAIKQLKRFVDNYTRRYGNEDWFIKDEPPENSAEAEARAAIDALNPKPETDPAGRTDPQKDAKQAQEAANQVSAGNPIREALTPNQKDFKVIGKLDNGLEYATAPGTTSYFVKAGDKFRTPTGKEYLAIVQAVQKTKPAPVDKPIDPKELQRTDIKFNGMPVGVFPNGSYAIFDRGKWREPTLAENLKINRMATQSRNRGL